MTRSRMSSARGAVGRALVLAGMLIPLAAVIATRGQGVGDAGGAGGAGGGGVSEGASGGPGSSAGSLGAANGSSDPIGTHDQGAPVALGMAQPGRLVLEPAFSPDGPMRGRVRVFDRRSGELLWDKLSPRANDLFGLSGLVVPDVDGDGVRDVAVSAPATIDAGTGVIRGVVSVLSGIDGAVVRTFMGDPGETFGVPLGVERKGGDVVLVVGLAWKGSDGATERRSDEGEGEAAGTGEQGGARLVGWRAFSLLGGEMVGEDVGAHEALLTGAARRSLAPRLRTSPPGDLNADGVTDGADLMIVLDGLGDDASKGGAGAGTALLALGGLDPLGADLNGDGGVDLGDVQVMMAALSHPGLPTRPLDEGDVPVVIPVCGQPGQTPCIICITCPGGGNGDSDTPGGTVGELPDDGGTGGSGSCIPPDSNACRDDDGDGIRNKDDCDSPYFTGDPSGCACQDGDGDGIKNQNDCDSPCYAGNPGTDCACQDADGDGVKNQDECDDPCTTARGTPPNCGAQVDLTIHMPPVIDSFQSAVPDDDELTVGAQTFVNLDNDDGDDFFDSNPSGTSDTDVPGENEMCRLTLSISNATDGSATLTAPSGASSIKVWQDARKTTAYQLGSALAVPGDFPGGIKELWVEGIQASTAQRQVKLRMTYSKGGQNDEVALTVLGIDSVTWVGNQNSRTDTNTLDDDPNWPSGLAPGAVRVFPGARVVNGTVEPNARDRVFIEVKLTAKTVAPVPVYLQVLDTDDPTADTPPLDDETSSTDNRGSGGTSPVVNFGANDDDAMTEFQVSMQPGDNFRVVAGADPFSLLRLENNDAAANATNADKQRITDSTMTMGTLADREVRLADHYASKVLTTWRFLHVEVDSMGPVTGNYVDGNIVWPPHHVDPNNPNVATELSMDKSLADGSPDLSMGTGNGRFEKGKLRVADTFDIVDLDGNGDYWVRKMAGMNVTSTPLPFTADDGESGANHDTWPGTITAIDATGTTLTVTISPTSGPADTDRTDGWDDLNSGIATLSIKGFGGSGPAITIVAANQSAGTFTIASGALTIPCRVFDDDLLVEGADVPQPDISGMNEVWNHAYVEPLADTGSDTNNAPFHEYTTDASAAHLADSRGSPTSTSTCWIVQVKNVFQTQDTAQPDFYYDMDPNSEGTYRAAAVAGAGGVFLATESIRDWIQCPLPFPKGAGGIDPDRTNPPRQFRYQEILNHEVGHLFGLAHSDGASTATEAFGGVMKATNEPRESSYFTAASLAKIRGRSTP